MLKAYYQLTKPGIIYGNILTATAGFLFATKLRHIHIGLLLATLIGTALVIAAACVFNNYIDRGIDKKMARTKKRALVQGAIPARNALVYATVLVLAGFGVLIAKTNWLVVGIGLVAFIDYVVLYGFYKRRSVYGTIVGSISGAAPVVAGYCAVTDRFDGAALILFLILVLWQMPHFYAIAMYRFDDYKNAGLPVLPVKKGWHATKVQIVVYIAAFVLAVGSLTAFGYAGYIFGIIMMLVGVAWLRQGIRGFTTDDNRQWARKLFFVSLLVILALSIMLSVGSRLA